METQVLIIGGGATGTGIARDLSLRGVKCMVVEMHDINNGASGGNHGLLHSGGRYVSDDSATARECREEGDIIKRMANHCVEDTGGLFVAVKGDDERFIADFPGYCEKSGIPCKEIDVREAVEMEPAISREAIAAYLVEDATIDPFKLSLENVSQAVSLGGRLLRNSKVVGFTIEAGRIVSTRIQNIRTHETYSVFAEQVVNACGAWSGAVAGMANVHIPMVCSKGSLLVTHERITQRVINRLRPPTDGDILVPGGTVSIFGTTSVRIDDPDFIAPTVEEVDHMIDQGARMVPVLETMRYIRAYSGVRPLVGNSSEKGGDRSVSRGFVLLDHIEEGLDNFTTITGGKLTSYRLMAEHASDLVCKKMSVDVPCSTRTEPLPSTIGGKWTEPGLAPKEWMNAHGPDDILLCECEMVPKSAVKAIIDNMREHRENPDLNAVSLRSRLGKGSCQGSFCSIRAMAYMYDDDVMKSDTGVAAMKRFLDERWKGTRSFLWGSPLMQAELQEAMHCGLLGLELY